MNKTFIELSRGDKVYVVHYDIFDPRIVEAVVDKRSYNRGLRLDITDDEGDYYSIDFDLYEEDPEYFSFIMIDEDTQIFTSYIEAADSLDY